MSEENQSLPKVIRIKPGSSDEKSIKGFLPESLQDATIDRVVDYFLDHLSSEGTRKDERITERIKAERTSNYGITANGEPVSGTDKVSEYFRETESPSGQKYQELELIIAAKQEGGLEYSRY